MPVCKLNQYGLQGQLSLNLNHTISSVILAIFTVNHTFAFKPITIKFANFQMLFQTTGSIFQFSWCCGLQKHSRSTLYLGALNDFTRVQAFFPFLLLLPPPSVFIFFYSPHAFFAFFIALQQFGVVCLNVFFLLFLLGVKVCFHGFW